MATKKKSGKSTSEGTQSTKKTSLKGESSKVSGGKNPEKSVKKKPILKKPPQAIAQRKLSSKKKSLKKKMYALMGELTITTSTLPTVNSVEKSFKTPNLLVDSDGNMFTKTSLEITVDGKRIIAVLDAEQVELFLKLLRVVGYSE